MLVRSNGADFPDGILVAYLVKEVINSPRGGLLKRIVWVDVHHFIVPSKVRRLVGPIERIEGHSTYSLYRPSILFMYNFIESS